MAYLQASRGNELAPRTQTESIQRLVQRLSDTEAHIGPHCHNLQKQTPSNGVSENEPFRRSLLGM